ncbi:glutamate ABC transporter substrate-binding protein [Nocardioides rubriscoriae]|uniref:glutamate ABC transporter substrate-binding protein n=1 Tax=Nocardioides rubriscoriae TaxID=642762 RepID=UPI0011DF85C0|nr:glutamate ABC transporter substrate-binding protein [Nocardioides rubriscoriae]
MKRLLAATAAVLVLAGCGGYDATVVPPPSQTPAPAAPVTTKPCTNDGTEVRSYDPAEGSRDGADVQRIRERGRLVAGVAADTLLLGARNPDTGDLEGFDIDMANAIAAEIFGTAEGHVEFKVITAADRIKFLQNGTIDVVARNMTVNCARWQLIAFSQVYFDAGQKVLVGKGSGITSIEDLAGKRICAPTGTTSIDNIQKIAPDAIPVEAGDNSACMIKFQNGEADGVSTDDTVLAGLAAQDPYAVVLDTAPLTREPYGIGVNKDNVSLVRLINGVLEDMRRDGRWQQYYDATLRPFLGKGQQPAPLYGR